MFHRDGAAELVFFGHRLAIFRRDVVPLGGAEGVEEHGEMLRLAGVGEINHAVGVPVALHGF